jgi:hypothetical protein
MALVMDSTIWSVVLGASRGVRTGSTRRREEAGLRGMMD